MSVSPCFFFNDFVIIMGVNDAMFFFFRGLQASLISADLVLDVLAFVAYLSLVHFPVFPLQKTPVFTFPVFPKPLSSFGQAERRLDRSC